MTNAKITAADAIKAAKLIEQRGNLRHMLASLQDAFDGDIDNLRVVVSVVALGRPSKVVEVTLNDSDDQAALFEVLHTSYKRQIYAIESALYEMGVEG